MLAAGKVIVNVDMDGKADLIAFDAKTGKQAWKVPHKAFRACYSTPFLHDGKLIVTTTAGITAYYAENGEKAWAFQWKFPTTMPLRTVGSSVVLGDMVFGCSGDGDGSRNMIGVRLPSGGKGDKIYTAFDKGFLICRDAKTGEEMWKHRLSANVAASLVLIDGKGYVFAENGDVTVFEATPTAFKALATNKLGEGVIASPAVADGRLYVRGLKHLFCIGKPKG
jgi:outer membrane protein assembly factor BamB